jgi:hypothetical protein
MKADFHHEDQKYSAEEIEAALGFVKAEFSLQAYAEAAHVDLSIGEIKRDPVFWLGTKLQGLSKSQAEWWLVDLADKVADHKQGES